MSAEHQPLLEYGTPRRSTRGAPGMAFGAVGLHALLLFGWGMALNDSAKGYLYCRLAMPCRLERLDVPCLFTAIGLAAIIGLGIVDRTWLQRSMRVAFYPALVFALIQLVAMWVCRRY